MAYFVVRTHSHTDRQQLWKVMSRPIEYKVDAEAWKEFFERKEKNPKHEYFIVSTE